MESSIEIYVDSICLYLCGFVNKCKPSCFGCTRVDETLNPNLIELK
jgi:hypothetical protein